jgi:hypothetical protein
MTQHRALMIPALVAELSRKVFRMMLRYKPLALCERPRQTSRLDRQFVGAELLSLWSWRRPNRAGKSADGSAGGEKIQYSIIKCSKAQHWRIGCGHMPYNKPASKEEDLRMVLRPCPHCGTTLRQSRTDWLCVVCGRLLPEELRASTLLPGSVVYNGVPMGPS